MQCTYHWKVVPSGTPTIIKNCSKCGNHSIFESSGNFRVNANQSLLDVWLIYQCRKCKSIWNMELLSRVQAKSIDKEIYHRYLQNDSTLAAEYAFDIAIHNHNKVSLSYDEINYEIIGEPIQHQKSSISIHLTSDYPLELRLDKLLSQHLCIPRTTLKRLHKDGRISISNSSDIKKVHLSKSGLLIQINFA